MTTLIDRLRGNPEQLSGWVLYEAADELDRQAKEIEALKADAERLMWLEQQHWDKDELFELVNNWKTKDGKRHPGGLMDAIGAAIAQQKETP